MSDQELDTTSSSPIVPSSRISAEDAGYYDTTQFLNSVEHCHSQASNSEPENPIEPRLLKLVDLVHTLTVSFPPFLQRDPRASTARSMVHQIRPDPDLSPDFRAQQVRDNIDNYLGEDMGEVLEYKLARAVVCISYQLFCRKRLLESRLTNANWSQPLHHSGDQPSARNRIVHRMFLKVAKEFPSQPLFEHATFEPVRMLMASHDRRSREYCLRNTLRKASLSDLNTPTGATLAIPQPVMDRYLRYLGHVADKYIDTRSLSIGPGHNLLSRSPICTQERVEQVIESDESGEDVSLNLTDLEGNMTSRPVRNISSVRITRNRSREVLEPWFYENLSGMVQVIRTLTRGHLCHLNKPS